MVKFMDNNDIKANLKELRRYLKRHVLALEANLSSQEIYVLFKLSEKLRLAGNELVNVMRKHYEQLMRTKKYRSLLKLYSTAKSSDQKKKDCVDQIKQLQSDYNVSQDFCRKTMRHINAKYKINSIFALSKADAIWKGLQTCLYGKGKTINFTRYGQFPAIIAMQINRGIVLTTKNDSLQFKCSKIVFGAKIKDTFEKEEVNAVIHYLKNQSQMDNEAINTYTSTGKCIDTYRPCSVSLVPKVIRGKRRIYIHITIEGTPKVKLNKNGQPRHTLGKGVVGLDLGPRSIAITYDGGVSLENIKCVGMDPEKAFKKAAELHSALDRSKRANNPQNYNEDGSLKPGKLTWNISKNGAKLALRLQNLLRKNTINRHLGIKQQMHRIRSFGDILITEDNRASSLAKRGKHIESSDNNSAVSTVVNVSNNSTQSNVQQQSFVTQSNTKNIHSSSSCKFHSIVE